MLRIELAEQRPRFTQTVGGDEGWLAGWSQGSTAIVMHRMQATQIPKSMTCVCCVHARKVELRKVGLRTGQRREQHGQKGQENVWLSR